jgi:hypothetical protein
MQPPVGVPAKGGPLMLALVTRPEGAKVMTTLAVPEGSPSLRHEEAWEALAVSAAVAAAGSKSPAGPLGVGGSGSRGLGSTFPTVGSASALGAGAWGSLLGASVAFGSGFVSDGAEACG